MEQRIEREWRSVRCPQEEERVSLMCEWDVVYEGGRILSRTLKEIDCHHPRLTVFGGGDCGWPCEKLIVQREKMVP